MRAFIILVSTSRKTSRHSITRGVGLGSYEKDYLLDLANGCETFSLLKIENESNVGQFFE